LTALDGPGASTYDSARECYSSSRSTYGTVELLKIVFISTVEAGLVSFSRLGFFNYSFRNTEMESAIAKAGEWSLAERAPTGYSESKEVFIFSCICSRLCSKPEAHLKQKL
jgi:hypothetical protein